MVLSCSWKDQIKLEPCRNLGFVQQDSVFKQFKHIRFTERTWWFRSTNHNFFWQQVTREWTVPARGFQTKNALLTHWGGKKTFRTDTYWNSNAGYCLTMFGIHLFFWGEAGPQVRPAKSELLRPGYPRWNCFAWPLFLGPGLSCAWQGGRVLGGVFWLHSQTWAFIIFTSPTDWIGSLIIIKYYNPLVFFVNGK